MPAREKIANRQLFFLLYMMRTTIVIAFLPVLTVADARQDAWLAALVSFIGAAVLVLCMAGLGVRYPEQTVVEYSQVLLGRWLGRAASAVVLWAFLVIAATDVRLYAEALITGFLTETPLLFIVSAMMILASLAAYAGIEVIGRVADILFVFFALMILISIVAALPQPGIAAANLQPVLARGFGPVWTASLVPSVVIVQFLGLTMLIPSTTEPRKALRTALWALLATTLTLALVAVVVVMVLGPDRGARTIFPFFAMVRTLQISKFLERLEVLAIFAWGFGLFVGVSVMFYCGARGLGQWFGLVDHRPLIGPMALICTTFAVHAYDDLFQLRSLFQPGVVVPYTLAWVLLPFGLLWLAYLWKSWRGRSHG